MDNLTCPVCRDLFEDPLLLSGCRHSVCMKCLHRIMSGDKSIATCPMCKRITPNRGPKGWQRNTELAQAVSKARNATKTPSKGTPQKQFAKVPTVEREMRPAASTPQPSRPQRHASDTQWTPNSKTPVRPTSAVKGEVRTFSPAAKKAPRPNEDLSHLSQAQRFRRVLVHALRNNATNAELLQLCIADGEEDEDPEFLYYVAGVPGTTPL